jgi:hypothetical protein
MHPLAKALSFALFAVAACERSPAPPAAEPSSLASQTSAVTPSTEGTTNQADASAEVPPVAPSAPAAEGPRETAIGKKDILVVSFFSPGDGTDHAAYDRLKAMLKSLAKVPPFVSHSWGKEGEHDECFDLSGLAASDRPAFLARVKEAIRSSKKVTITENGTCSEGR